jgi:pimeloyl-ACP methyl ester carboxylesterase
MPSVQVGAVEVAYGVEGEGAPLLLVHGTTQSRVAWLQLAPLLAPTFEVIMPELPGSGETLDPGGVLEVADLAHQMVAVADALGHERFHLAGYSLGAVVAAEAAAQVSARVRSLTLLCGWATTDARMRFTFDLWDRLLKADPELFARYAFADGFTVASFELFGASIEELLPEMAASFATGSDRQLELDQRVDIAHRLSAITAPTLVVGALDDRWVDVRHSRELAERIPTARLVELPCGHVGPVSELVVEVSTMIAAHATGR